ncbi:hypothetical protein FDP41_010728 [Naegleria fowleri]|uniref:RGS domain-containing protein n=1 Tax=Naegleria fowleri TaxID=5763 RepID=A0A6A5CBV6_NAEFO|nr:uncharacterized protein FDP41_010728 [Naegleria fowleri]KAF0982749.1 hypothetical protein FDP41_010728 [Naegleria fowleri]
MHHSDEGGLSMLPPTTTTTTTNDDKFSTIFNVYEIQQYSLHNKLFFEKFNSLVSDFVILETPVNISNASQLQGCNPILFQLGNFSRDGAVLTASGCPETWLSFSFSLFFLLCYLMLLVLCCLGLIWKRKSRHVQSRGMVYMVLTLVASSFIVILSCLRYIIGRKNYPCFIYAISYFVLPPALILPSIFRCFRLYLMHVLNLNKTNLVFVKDYDRSMNFDAGAVNANLQLCTHSSVEFQSDPRKNLKHEFVTPQQQQQTNQEKKVDFEVSDVTSVGTIDDDMRNDVLTIVTPSDQDLKKVKILSFFVSDKFVIGSYVVLFVFHAIIYLVLGGIEFTQVHSTNTGIFTTRGVFQVSGCGISSSTLFMVGVVTFFYILVETILFVLCLIFARDTWFIWKETATLIGLKLCAIILFVVFGFVPIFSKLLDFFIPYGYVLLVYSCCEIIVSVLLPVLYSIVMDARQKRGNSPEHASFNPSEESGLEQCLKQKKTFNTILEFARKSFCPEPVLCYRDIERFTKTTNSKNRRKLAPHIANTYLKQNSPLQLNYPKVNEAFHECMAVIHRCSDNGTIIPSDLFKNIQLHCLNDMTDIFERLKRQDRDIKEVVHQWNLSSLAKPVQTNGQ